MQNCLLPIFERKAKGGLGTLLHLAASCRVTRFRDFICKHLALLHSTAQLQQKLPSPELPTIKPYSPFPKAQPSTKPWGGQFRLKPR